SGIYRAYLDAHLPEPSAREGDVVDKGAQRFYRPDPIDERFGATDPYQPDSSQSDMYGCLDIPRAHTRTAFDANQTIDALERLKDDTFTLHCSFGPPHPPMISTEYYFRQFDPSQMPLPNSFDDPMTDSPYRKKWEALSRYQNPDTIGYMIANYYALVKEVDDHVGRILDKLDELGLTDNTLVVFTSDHGEMLGAHGMKGKFVFYEESVHIPLLMRLPGVIRAGTKVDAPISQRDFFATFLDYLNCPDPGSQGYSFRGLIEGNGWDGDDFVVAEWESTQVPSFMVRTDRWKLMFGRSPDAPSVDALYDLVNDPLEMNNVIDQHNDMAQELKDRLVSWLGKVDSPHLDGVMARMINQ
ncbi:MAG: sulfatase-like hydrolase/transferase, partial [Candidatus Latescibacteria bacterium]|nr:sulfatase-like hydrolase/transferase [Candidatus Latescibacterota bacterium]